jgi:hypothetical protein
MLKMNRSYDWEVREICGERVKNGEKEYLLEWQHSRSKEWIPEERVNGCDVLLEEYKKRVREQRKKKRAMFRGWVC